MLVKKLTQDQSLWQGGLILSRSQKQRQETRLNQFQEGQGPELPPPLCLSPCVSLCLSLRIYLLSVPLSVSLCFCHLTPFKQLPQASLQPAYCPGVFLGLAAYAKSCVHQQPSVFKDFCFCGFSHDLFPFPEVPSPIWGDSFNMHLEDTFVRAHVCPHVRCIPTCLH